MGIQVHVNEVDSMSPIKQMLLQKQQNAFKSATTPAQRLAVVAETQAILGADREALTKASPTDPLLRALSATLITLS